MCIEGRGEVLHRQDLQPAEQEHPEKIERTAFGGFKETAEQESPGQIERIALRGFKETAEQESPELIKNAGKVY